MSWYHINLLHTFMELHQFFRGQIFIGFRVLLFYYFSVISIDRCSGVTSKKLVLHQTFFSLDSSPSVYELTLQICTLTKNVNKLALGLIRILY